MTDKIEELRKSVASLTDVVKGMLGLFDQLLPLMKGNAQLFSAYVTQNGEITSALARAMAAGGDAATLEAITRKIEVAGTQFKKQAAEAQRTIEGLSP